MAGTLSAVLMLAVSVPCQGTANEPWTQADLSTIRLDPERFTDLPRRLRRELTRRGCTIPQTFTAGAPHNVISGRFRNADQVDWAVLCSRRRTSSILVFWAGSPHAAEELSLRSDASYLQWTGPAGIGYSRAIGVASPAFIRRMHAAFGGPEPPRLDHDGIDDAFIEKASIVLYWHRGKWLRLTGMD
jgi:hypothetical protein